MRKKVQVIILSTDKADVKFQLWRDNSDNSLYINPKWITDNTIPQHLYFITDDEIKEEDWMLVGKDNRLMQCIGVEEHVYLLVNNNNGVFKEACKKIVATTNPKLWFNNREKNKNVVVYDKIDIPKIPQSFIEEYVNKQGNIKEVELEYKDIGGEEWQGDDYNGEPFWNRILRLQLNSDGSVIWYLIEDKKMYTREEIEDILHRLYEETMKLTHISKGDIKAWFDKNYPK